MNLKKMYMKLGLMPSAEANVKSGYHILNYLETGEFTFLMLKKILNYFEFQIQYKGWL